MLVRAQASGAGSVRGAERTTGPEGGEGRQIVGSVLAAGAAVAPSRVLRTADPAAVAAGGLRLPHLYADLRGLVSCAGSFGLRHEMCIFIVALSTLTFPAFSQHSLTSYSYPATSSGLCRRLIRSIIALLIICTRLKQCWKLNCVYKTALKRTETQISLNGS